MYAIVKATKIAKMSLKIKARVYKRTVLVGT